MSMDALIAPLRGVALFQGLKPLQVTEIARQAERVVFARGTMITRAGTQGDAAFLIVAGIAERVDDPAQGQMPEPIAPGSLIGEMAMLVPHEYGASIVARSPVRSLKITRAALHAQMLEDPGLAEALMHKIASRLNTMALELRRIDAALAEAPSAHEPRPPARGLIAQFGAASQAVVVLH